MTQFHVTTDRVVDPETGEVSFVTTEVPFTVDEEAAFAAQVAIVPRSVTPYQARKALSNANLRAQVEAAVSAASLDVQDAWNYGLSVERSSPLITSIGAGLGLSSDQIDDLFRSAATII